MAGNQDSPYKVVKGLSENWGRFTGRVKDDPVHYDNATIFELYTIAAERDQNNQLTDRIQVVPITVLDQDKINVIKKHVSKDRQLQVDTYYKSWEVDGQKKHALVLTKLKLGADSPENYRKQQQQKNAQAQGGGGGGGFDIPV